MMGHNDQPQKPLFYTFNLDGLQEDEPAPVTLGLSNGFTQEPNLDPTVVAH